MWRTKQVTGTYNISYAVSAVMLLIGAVLVKQIKVPALIKPDNSSPAISG
jgi:alanine dehydrogenase